MNTKKELVEYVYDLHLQNNTEKIDFDRAFKYGIECAIDELEELNKLSLHNVSEPFYCKCKEPIMIYKKDEQPSCSDCGGSE